MLCVVCIPFISPGLELALRHMKAGEKCLVRCETRFAYGPDGCPATQPGDKDLPPDANVELSVELLEVLSTTPLANMMPVEKIVEFNRRKAMGNGHYARKDFRRALRSYLSVLSSLSGADFSSTADKASEARQLQIDCGNNLAMVYTRLGDLERAKEAAVDVLVLDPANTKALFRAGQISSRQGNFAEAKTALRKALEGNPESKEVKAELGRLASRVKAYKDKKQAIRETMGRGLLATPTAQVEATASSNTVHTHETSVESCDAHDVDAADLKRGREAKSASIIGKVSFVRFVFFPLVVALAAWGAAHLFASTR